MQTPPKTQDKRDTQPELPIAAAATDTAKPVEASGKSDPPPSQPQAPDQEPKQEPKQDVDPKPDAVVVKRTPVPFYPTNADEMWRYATMLAGSDLIPRSLKDKNGKGIVANIHLVLMKGHDLGLKPMQSIGAINIVEGKAEIGAQLMVALILKSGMCKSWRLVYSDTERAVYSTMRVGDLEPTEFEYTIQEADQMGLLNKGRDEQARANNQWRKQPRTMLRRRAQSNLAREVYPDVVMGMYDHDELSENNDRLGLDTLQMAEAIDVDGKPVRRVVPVLTERVRGPIEKQMLENPDVFAAQRAMASTGDPLKDRLRGRRGQREERDPDYDDDRSEYGFSDYMDK